jgi:hypothetical protein
MSAMSMRAALPLLLAIAGCTSESSSNTGADATFPPDAITTTASDSGGLHIDVRTAPSQPPPRGTCTVELTVTDASGAPKDGLAVDVVPWMPAHGHGASVVPTVVAKGAGKYVVTNVSLFMPGEWELRTTFGGPLTDHATPMIEVQ